MTLADLRLLRNILAPGQPFPITREQLDELFADIDAPRKTTATQASDSSPADEMLTADEAAAILKTSPRWCYDHGDELGVRRLSRRCVRFSRRAVERRLARTRVSQS